MPISTNCNNAIAPNILATPMAHDVIKPSSSFERETDGVCESAEVYRTHTERYIRQAVGKTDPVFWQLTKCMQ